MALTELLMYKFIPKWSTVFDINEFQENGGRAVR